MNPTAIVPPPSAPAEPVSIFGDIETEARGLAYGAMVFDVHPGRSTEAHSHGSEEIWLVCEGTGQATIGDRRIELAAGTRVTVPPGVPHLVANTADRPLKVIAFWWREAGHGG
jgi:mannose-6-phosphate isomerase-like protein (cupin superfamily)